MNDFGIRTPLSRLHPPSPLRGLVLCLALLHAPAPFAQNLQRGQALYEDHCQACHEDFKPPQNRNVRTPEELRKRIAAWAAHMGADWGKSEIDDVLHYLNEKFYRFDHQAL